MHIWTYLHIYGDITTGLERRWGPGFQLDANNIYAKWEDKEGMARERRKSGDSSIIEAEEEGI